MYPREQSGSSSRCHHFVKKIESVARLKGKSYDYNPATQQQNLVDSATKFAHALPHRVHDQNKGGSSCKSHSMSSHTNNNAELNENQLKAVLQKEATHGENKQEYLPEAFQGTFRKTKYSWVKTK